MKFYLEKKDNGGWVSLVMLVISLMAILFLFFANMNMHLNRVPAAVFDSDPSENTVEIKNPVAPVATLESATMRIKKIEQQQAQRGDEIMREIAELQEY